MQLRKSLFAAGVVGLTMFSASQVRSETISVFDATNSPPTGVAGAVEFTYEAQLVEGSNGPGGAPGSDSQVRIGDFFTIYDFGPVTASTIPGGWTLTQSLVGVTPPGGSQPVGHIDDPFTLNATLTYTVGSTINADPLTSLGFFYLTSNAPNLLTRIDSFISKDTREVGSDGVEDSIPLLSVNPGHANGEILVPADAFAVPTPTAALGGLALMGLLAFKKRRI